MVTSAADNMITLLATLGIDARQSVRSASIEIDRFPQWVDEDPYLQAMPSMMCTCSIVPADHVG